MQPVIQKTHGTTHTRTGTRCRTQRRNRFTPGTTAATPAAHRTYPSSLTAATLHRKTQGFVLQLPPQNAPHATVMQPLQCVLQHHVSNPHASTHMAPKRDNNHAAMALRSASADSKTPFNIPLTPSSVARGGWNPFKNKIKCRGLRTKCQ